MVSGQPPLPSTSPVPGDQYALVSYIEGQLGDFLLALRQEIVRDCQLRSHISILPPRPLASSEAAALTFVRDIAQKLGAFQVVLGEVEVFDKSDVIYLGIQKGHTSLVDKYWLFNQDGLHFVERYGYHPHVTLAQELTADLHPEALEVCRARWAEYRGPRSFAVDSLTFVRHQHGCGWLDLAQFRLEMAASRS